MKKFELHSLKVQYMAFMTAVLLILLLLLNTFPLTSSRDSVFEEKRRALGGQAATLASSLANLEHPSETSIGDVLKLLDVRGYARIAVADAEGKLIYDDGGRTGEIAELDDVITALGGKTVFRSDFESSAFLSSYAMPMYSQGTMLGAVYISEYDAERAQMILDMQGRIRAASIVIVIAALILGWVFVGFVLSRIGELVKSMRIVAAGNYGYRLATRGRDEITELGDEFNMLTERLETTERQRRRFVSDASHELKTPLASIRLLADSIVQSENMDAATVREFVTDIGQEAERLQRTTEKLLNLSRMDDEVHVEPEPVDVKRVYIDVLVLLRPLAEERRVRIRSELDEGCVVMATVDDMFHIIFNLVENAVKYNVEGGSVYVSLKGDESSVRLCVEDTGIGIPEEDRLNIFSRFYRVDKARSREAGGSGLGLSIVQDAVKLHGGSITVGPNKPQGSKFTVRFPRPTQEETGI